MNEPVACLFFLDLGTTLVTVDAPKLLVANGLANCIGFSRRLNLLEDHPWVLLLLELWDTTWFDERLEGGFTPSTKQIPSVWFTNSQKACLSSAAASFQSACSNLHAPELTKNRQVQPLVMCWMQYFPLKLLGGTYDPAAVLLRKPAFLDCSRRLFLSL